MKTMDIIKNYEKGLITYNEAAKLSDLRVDLSLDNVIKPSEMFSEIAKRVDDVTLTLVNDYSKGYLSDIITEIADSLTPIYYNDLIKSITETKVSDYIVEAVDIWSKDDLWTLIQAAYMLMLEDDCSNNELDMFRLIILKQFNHFITEDVLEAIVDRVINYDKLEDVITVAKWYSNIVETEIELLDDYVKDWLKYTEYDYMIDWLKADNLTFKDCLYSLKHSDFYKDIIGDSIGREVLFSALAERLNLSYNDIYSQWK